MEHLETTCVARGCLDEGVRLRRHVVFERVDAEKSTGYAVGLASAGGVLILVRKSRHAVRLKPPVERTA